MATHPQNVPAAMTERGQIQLDVDREKLASADGDSNMHEPTYLQRGARRRRADTKFRRRHTTKHGTPWNVRRTWYSFECSENVVNYRRLGDKNVEIRTLGNGMNKTGLAKQKKGLWQSI